MTRRPTTRAEEKRTMLMRWGVRDEVERFVDARDPPGCAAPLRSFGENDAATGHEMPSAVGFC